MVILEYLSNPFIRRDVEPLFIDAFPENERPPADYYFNSFKDNKRNILCGFYDKDQFVGFISVSIYKDICYIFFLAVSPSQRNRGYGSQMLQEMKKLYKDYVLLLCYEEVDKKYDDYDMRLKRENFYKRNGFKDNHLKTNEFGVVFQTAYIGSHQASFEDYQNIFRLGFGEFAIKYLKEEK